MDSSFIPTLRTRFSHSSNGKSMYPRDSTLKLYLRAPTKYVFFEHMGLGNKLLGKIYPEFTIFPHRLLFTSSYILFNKAEFPQAIDGSINQAKRQRKTVGASAAVDLSSVAKKHCPNSHAGPECACKNSGFYEFHGKFTKLLLKI